MGRPLYTHGWHFVADSFSPDGRDLSTPYAHTDHPDRYFLVGFGCSMGFLFGPPHLATNEGGRDQDPPELGNSKLFDPFKLDIFTTGSVLLRDSFQVRGLCILSNRE